MARRGVLLVALGVVFAIAAGVLVASNMGFRFRRDLQLVGTATGKNTIALPYNRQVGLVDAQDLINDINNTGTPTDSVVNFQQFDSATDSLIFYSGAVFDPPAPILEDGQAYFIKVSTDVQFLITGTHDPTLSLHLEGPGATWSGTNFVSWPYHAVAQTAGQLLLELNDGMECAGAPAAAIQKWQKETDSLFSYDGCSGEDFDLDPGEGYFVIMASTLDHVPAHY